jgi:hypothetical protein
MHPIHAEPLRKAAHALTTLRLLFNPLRLVLVAMLVAFARGLGGAPYVPNPAPRNLPAEVERKR